MTARTRLLIFAPLVAIGIGAVACSDAAGPGPNGAIQFSRDITLPDLEQRLVDGPTRVEIELAREFFPDRLVAREVEVETPDELADDEEIEARIADIAVTGGEGTLFLEIPGLTVTFDDVTTRFRSENGRDLTFDEFVTRVQDALAAGGMPAVEAKRDPPAEPQAPDVSTFFALKLELDDEADDPEIEITIDDRHLVVNATSSPDAILTVLGLEIELLVTDGITELEAELDEMEGEIEFEGIVKSVNLTDNEFTLMNGTVVRLVAATKVEQDDDDDALGSLAEVADAVDAGLMVEAEGEGLLESTDPRVIVAAKVEFEVEDDAEDMPGIEDFEGEVASVDVTARTFTLAGGPVIRIVDGTKIKDGSDRLTSLQAVADARAAGGTVIADGKGLVETFTPRQLIAIEVEFELRP